MFLMEPCQNYKSCLLDVRLIMVATIEMLEGQELARNEYASHFLRRTGDIQKLQALWADRLPGNEIMRLAMYERELRLGKQRTNRCQN